MGMNMNFPFNMNNNNLNWASNYSGMPNFETGDDYSDTIIFNFRSMTISIPCNLDEKVKDIIDRFIMKGGINPEDRKSLKFYFNCKPLCETLTLAQAGISNCSRILVAETKNVKFVSFQDNEPNNEDQKKVFIKI